MASTFDPTNVNLNTANPAEVVCYIEAAGNEYDGMLGARVSSIFVIFAISTIALSTPMAERMCDGVILPEADEATILTAWMRFWGLA